MDGRIGARLKELRLARNWSLDELAKMSGVSRATLSRLENAEVSPTASMLGKLCTAHGMPMSRLIRLVEEELVPLVERGQQWVWEDPGTGFRRRQVSPPSRALSGEVIECELPAGADISYEAPSRPGLEHHLLLQDGMLTITVEARTHHLKPGDCLRYQTFGSTRFSNPGAVPARYILFMI